MASEEVVEQYARLQPTYERFAHKIKALLQEMLEAQGIKVQAVEGRGKEASKFGEKISRSGKSYKNPIRQITDLAGVRVILYYKSDVEKVCDLIDSEFVVDARSIDKASELAENQF